MSDTLVLNADFQPLSLVPLSVMPWQQAIKLLYLDRVTLLHEYTDKDLHSPSITMPMPSVVVTKKYYNVKLHAKFNRYNLFLRDLFVCQYCGDQFSIKELTIDHVVPRCRGGKTSWTNCVTSCKKCNSHKGSKLINPISKPIQPSYFKLAKNKSHLDFPIKDEVWRDYL